MTLNLHFTSGHRPLQCECMVLIIKGLMFERSLKIYHQVKDYSEQVLECALLPVWESINKACLSSCTFLNVLQRFFVNEAYWQHPDGPVFLYIGGEGPLVEYDVLTGHHSDMAEEHGALLLALEHRFYGDMLTLYQCV
uniref:Uncharacterized protein n=1 Tax=Neolamprologus brichardi TaxID=32507 RepID=A0A3Q4HET5_NEOBR